VFSTCTSSPAAPPPPTAVVTEYASVAGLPVEVPYWSFGFHQRRFRYNNFIDVADAISNYSAARMPLETMWTDIDYMQKRRVFTLDPDYFPLNRMRGIVDYLHKHDQRYIVMVDPAVAYLPEDKTSAYQRGSEMDVWLKRPNGSDLLCVVWPGVTVYPKRSNPKTQR
jgi:alpha-glucosidase